VASWTHADAQDTIDVRFVEAIPLRRSVIGGFVGDHEATGAVETTVVP
jgi:hypothetical protein